MTLFFFVSGGIIFCHDSKNDMVNAIAVCLMIGALNIKSAVHWGEFKTIHHNSRMAEDTTMYKRKNKQCTINNVQKKILDRDTTGSNEQPQISK